MPINHKIDELLNDVVKQNGRPIVISRYGWKVEEINGKKYMMAMTEDEHNEFISDAEKRGLITSVPGACSMDDSGNCHHTNCTGSCSVVIIGGQFACACN